jgi:DNA mismatch repair protein MutS
MRQYNSIKKDYKDSILFYRMGDFYETFFDDAKTVAKELNIVLTAREKNKGKQIPLAGVPHHAAEAYIARLIKKGYKVAVCDQVEDPKQAKGIVKRQVTRVITPGTVLEDSILKSKDNNYLMAVVFDSEDDRFGIAWVDISTGEFSASEGEHSKSANRLITDITRVQPSECIISEEANESRDNYNEFFNLIDTHNIALSPYRNETFNLDFACDLIKEHLNILTLEGLGCQDKPLATIAAGVVLSYLQETQKAKLNYINHLTVQSTSDFMVLDATTLKNLELIQNIRDRSKKGTLLEILDKTVTAMGLRMLRKNIQQPLIDRISINRRLDTVEEFTNNIFLRQDLREQLAEIYDLERLISRVAFGTANARDLLALKQSLLRIPIIKRLIKNSTPVVKSQILLELEHNLPDLSKLAQKIETAIVPEPPATIKDGGIFRSGYSEDLDRLKSGTKDARTWISGLEAKERRRTGIPNLRVGFNKVFGYYIEVRKTHLKKVPNDYIRKQTLVNAERYITNDLKERESLILSADEKIKVLEYSLFIELRELVAAKVKDIQTAASALAELDMFTSLSEVAINNDYTRPTIEDSDILEIYNGRHPVVETLLDTGFVANDTYLDCIDNQLIILTGPNMAGKSTYMRQIALITIMAQLGSFVPAERAVIGMADRIFTRVGAFDDLTRGQSTFMVEMVELANILNSATNKSLILLDEIGRGTSTFDGLSIAWAVSEFIHSRAHIGAKTLFATHYHHLNELAEVLPGVKNFNIEVKEDEDQITFLYKVKPGGTDRSYGIQVARLAGLPPEVIERAKTILAKIESENLIRVNGENKVTQKSRSAKTNLVPYNGQESPNREQQMVSSIMPKEGGVQSKSPNRQWQLKLFESESNNDHSEVISELKSLDIKNITPLQALNKLYEFQKKIDSEKENSIETTQSEREDRTSKSNQNKNERQ